MRKTLPSRGLRLQQSLASGGSQHRGNLNVQVKYIWVDKEEDNDPLDQVNFTATHDRNLYNNWHKYNELKFCFTSTELQPDLQVSVGAMSMLYGEVSSLHS